MSEPRDQGMGMNFRTIYNHGGEIITALVCAAIGLYIFSSLSDSRAILEYEDAARRRLREIYRLEKEVLGKEQGGEYEALSRLGSQSSKLEPLNHISSGTDGRSELHTDGHYYYYFLLRYEERGARDVLRDVKDQEPIGYRVLAWPRTFAVTGELGFYVDERGYLLYCPNDRAYYEGREDFHFDWEPMDSSIRDVIANQQKKYDIWMLDSPLE